MEGGTYIKLYRKSMESSVFYNPIYWKVWCWCLMRASWEDKVIPFNGRDIVIHRGEFITGREKACKILRISAQNYKSALSYLKSTNRVTSKVTNKFSIISVINWGQYQPDIKKVTSKVTSKVNNQQPASNQPATTYKNIKKLKNIYIRIYITPKIKNKFSTRTINDFLLYWEETDLRGIPRWQKEKTWNTERRLLRWQRNQERWDRDKSNYSKSPRVQSSNLTSIKEILNNYEKK